MTITDITQNRALALIGCKYCARCKGAALINTGKNYCKACIAVRASNHYRNGGGKERQAAWVRANRERNRAYQRLKYQRKKARPGE